MRHSQRSGVFEGQSNDPRAIAERVATYGLKVYCTDCGKQHRHFSGRGPRLGYVPSPCCGSRMRPARWRGWAAWRLSKRSERREEPATVPDRRIERVGGEFYMRGLDS